MVRLLSAISSDSVTLNLTICTETVPRSTNTSIVMAPILKTHMKLIRQTRNTERRVFSVFGESKDFVFGLICSRYSDLWYASVL